MWFSWRQTRRKGLPVSTTPRKSRPPQMAIAEVSLLSFQRRTSKWCLGLVSHSANTRRPVRPNTLLLVFFSRTVTCKKRRSYSEQLWFSKQLNAQSGNPWRLALKKIQETERPQLRILLPTSRILLFGRCDWKIKDPRWRGGSLALPDITDRVGPVQTWGGKQV